MGIGATGPDDHIGEAVAIDIAGTGDRSSTAVIRRYTVKPEAVAAIKGGQINTGGKARGFAEHHIARS